MSMRSKTDDARCSILMLSYYLGSWASEARILLVLTRKCWLSTKLAQGNWLNRVVWKTKMKSKGYSHRSSCLSTLNQTSNSKNPPQSLDLAHRNCLSYHHQRLYWSTDGQEYFKAPLWWYFGCTANRNWFQGHWDWLPNQNHWYQSN